MIRILLLANILVFLVNIYYKYPILRCIQMAIVVRKARFSFSLGSPDSRMNRTAEFSPPGRIRALLMDPDIKKWEYCFYTPSTPGQRTQMYFDNKASKHDTTHDKFSCVYLHPSKSKDMSTQRHSETRCYPLLPPLRSAPRGRSLMRGLCAGSKRSSLQVVPPGFKGLQRSRLVSWG